MSGNSAGGNLKDLRILVAEDEGIVALEIEASLQGFGCEVVGPVGKLEQALKAIQTQSVDGAVLDVNLGGVEVFPVADELLARGIPVILSTGYNDLSLFPERFRGLPCLEKPYDEKDLFDLMARVVRRP